MEGVETKPIQSYFTVIQDPRVERNKKYPLINIIVITLLAVMSWAKGWEAIAQYATLKRRWLSKFLDLSAGVPPHDVYRRVINRLKPEEIEGCFIAWVRDVKKAYKDEIIAIDGKTVRGSFNAKTGAKAIHVVSAWATANRLVFAQVKTDEKSNEITAIPVLLDKLALEGCVVTIDAMGCQHEIATKIVKKKGDYVLALKENQPTLHEDVKEYFSDLDFSKPKSAAQYIRFETASSHEEKRGRIENRDYAISDDVAWLIKGHPDWKTIRSIGMVEATREVQGVCSTERRYFVSSLKSDAEKFAKAVRSHWGIENSLHYVLDVVFGEDRCRIKSENGPENMAIFRKLAMSIARCDKESTESMIMRVRGMAWSEEYLEKLFFHSDFPPDPD